MYKGTLVFYINTLNKGGAERVIIQVAKHFAMSGYKSVLVTSFVGENEYPVPDEVERIAIEEKPTKQNKITKNLKRIGALRKICKTYKPDAVISFMAEPNMRAVLATRASKTKVIVSVRNDPNREYAGRLGRFVGKHILPRADGCVFQTEEAREWFPASLQKKSKVIFNDVDNIFFETEYKGGKDIVTLGRLTKQKNHKMLIDAFGAVADKYSESNLLIYGMGELENELRQYIAERNLTSRVILMGLTSDSNKVLSEAGVFVLSSDYEGMPNALLEALAIGVPSISTDCPCGGPRMLIENGKNGLLVPIKDSEAMAKALDLMLSDGERRKEISGAAKASANRYSTEKVFAEWRDFVESVISKKQKDKI